MHDSLAGGPSKDLVDPLASEMFPLSADWFGSGGFTAEIRLGLLFWNMPYKFTSSSGLALIDC
jgi:hypothetical protein